MNLGEMTLDEIVRDSALGIDLVAGEEHESLLGHGLPDEQERGTICRHQGERSLGAGPRVDAVLTRPRSG